MSLFLLSLVLWSATPPSFAALPLHVVTTIAPLTDIVKHIGGDVIRVHGLVPQGVNAHLFRPSSRDVRYLAEADIIVLNGLHLEVPIEKLARRSGRPGVRIVKLGDNTIRRAAWVFDFTFPRAQGHPNPHLWLNVAYTMTYTTLIRDQLVALDPDNRAVYHDNTTHYRARLARLDQCISRALATVPPRQRKLLTYHDSWPYFAQRYGLSVIGAVQPANFFEPSPREIARLITQIRREQIPAVFGSAVFPSKVLTKIATETGVRYVTALRDDTLPGPPGAAKHSYIGMMLTNVHAMVEALGGDPAILTPCTSTLLHENK